MSAEELAQIDDLEKLFLDDTPLLDVRAPVEFAEGAFPHAENLPLIDDVERHAIGITYKQQGQDAALEHGESLVSGEHKAQRIAQWRDYLQRHPDAVLYCFRGGMRSQISQRWLLEETGIHCPRVRGGYKAMRRFLIEQLEVNSEKSQPIVIGGRTGVGKTRLLIRCGARIDLEGLANHRGSAFGQRVLPQPSQIDFENGLSIAMMKRVAAGNRPFVVEDESRNIGSRHLPACFFERLAQAPLVVLEATDQARIDITLQEYVHEALAEFEARYGTQRGFALWREYLLNSLDRIRRRLGGPRHQEARRLMSAALDAHARSGDVGPHRAWIAYLLTEYYDDMYTFQLNRKSERIVFRGTHDDVCAYLHDVHGMEIHP